MGESFDPPGLFVLHFNDVLIYKPGILLMQDKKQPNVKEILLALANHVNAKGIRGLAEFLEIGENRLYAWIGRGRIGDTGSILAKLPNVRLDWLKTGEGEMMANIAAEPNAQDLLPDPARMTLEQKLQWLGFKTKDIRQMQEWSKLSEEEQDEELRRLCNQNLEKGRY